MKISLVRASLAFGLFVFMSAASAQQGFSFVALGDLPYGSPDKAYGPYRALIDRINQVGPDFSIHVGDFKSGSTLCSDAEFANQREHFQRFQGAVVYTPGDNEWTDCHRANNGAYDPLERLAALRQGFFHPISRSARNPCVCKAKPSACQPSPPMLKTCAGSTTVCSSTPCTSWAATTI